MKVNSSNSLPSRTLKPFSKPMEMIPINPLVVATSSQLGSHLAEAEVAKREEIAEAERLEKLKSLLSSLADHD